MECDSEWITDKVKTLTKDFNKISDWATADSVDVESAMGKLSGWRALNCNKIHLPTIVRQRLESPPQWPTG